LAICLALVAMFVLVMLIRLVIGSRTWTASTARADWIAGDDWP
jgi:hypothetical protein